MSIERAPPARKTFLFLQGHPSSFARELAKALERRGHRALRVNFCLGDALFGMGQAAVSYRGSFEDWPTFLADLIHREGITDVLYYGDRRPYHLEAAKVADALGVRSYVYEFGYLRPDWLTLERGQMTSGSHFPVDPDLIREIGAKFDRPDLTARYSSPVAIELFHEIVYNLSSYFLHVLYPRYRADRYYNPILEYLTGIPRQLRLSAYARRANAIVDGLLRDKTGYFLYPLQLQCDYQIRHHSPFRHQSDAIDFVLRSFAAHAPERDHIVFKCHPLDNGGEGWPDHIARTATRLGIASRVHYIDGGNLELLLKTARGCVLINSTVGMHAISLGCPLNVLGTAVFDIPTLSDPRPLDDFWTAPLKPDAPLADALLRAMAGTIQVKGSFFSWEGKAHAIRVFVERLENETVNGSGAFISPPPRLAGEGNAAAHDRPDGAATAFAGCGGAGSSISVEGAVGAEDASCHGDETEREQQDVQAEHQPKGSLRIARCPVMKPSVQE